MYKHGVDSCFRRNDNDRYVHLKIPPSSLLSEKIRYEENITGSSFIKRATSISKNHPCRFADYGYWVLRGVYGCKDSGKGTPGRRDGVRNCRIPVISRKSY